MAKLPTLTHLKATNVVIPWEEKSVTAVEPSEVEVLASLWDVPIPVDNHYLAEPELESLWRTALVDVEANTPEVEFEFASESDWDMPRPRTANRWRIDRPIAPRMQGDYSVVEEARQLPHSISEIRAAAQCTGPHDRIVRPVRTESPSAALPAKASPVERAASYAKTLSSWDRLRDD